MSRYAYNTSDLLPKRQRRTRFTLVVEGREEPVVALTYSAQAAVDLANKRGWKVTKVIKGDYRKIARAREAKANGGFTIDQRALAAAKQELGIVRPVKIYRNSKVGGTDGKHRWTRGTQYHKVMLKSYLTPEQASFALWHELQHCKQCEDASNCLLHWEGWAKVMKDQRDYPYKYRPIEIEANQVAAAHANVRLTY